MENWKEQTVIGLFLRDLKYHIKFLKFRRNWRSQNKHNAASAGNIFDPALVRVGNFTYGELRIISFHKNSRLSIGSLCSIGPEVTFLLDADHRTDTISTYPFCAALLKTRQYEAVSKGSIRIDDDVWIGYGALILSGVHIGQGAVIAAGSIVTRDIPPYAVAGGNPARVIRYRFHPELIDRLLNVNFSCVTKKMAAKHEKELYQNLTDPGQLDWLPSKPPAASSKSPEPFHSPKQEAKS